MKPSRQETLSLAELLSGDPRSTREERGLMLFHQGELQPAEPRPAPADEEEPLRERTNVPG